jgi:hypothetical protein
MTDDRQLRDALHQAFPPTTSTAAWPGIEERGRRARRRRRVVLTSTTLLLLAMFAVAGVQGYRIFSGEKMLVITGDISGVPTDRSTPHWLTDYQDQLVDPASLENATLARIVRALLARDLPVIDAAVAKDAPLALSLTIGQDEAGEPALASEQAKRVAVAEAVREGKLRELQVTVVDPSGSVVTEATIQLPEGVQFVLADFQAPTLDLEEARHRLTRAVKKMDLAPIRVEAMRLTEDVLDARQLHIRLLGDEFEKNVEGYEIAASAISDRVSISRRQGSGIAVLRVDLVNDQGQLLVALWADAQLGTTAYQLGLVKDEGVAQRLTSSLRGDGRGRTAPLDLWSIKAYRPGIDESLNDEFVYFQVLVSGSFAGYSLEDEAGHRYEFPDRVFTRGQPLKLHTGTGMDTSSDLYWGSSSPMWEDGDTAFLLDPQGRLLLETGYSSE